MGSSPTWGSRSKRDGQQHFRTIDAINHDFNRDKYLVENGWIVYRIAWLELKNDNENIVKCFFDWLDQNDKKCRKYDVDELLKKVKKTKYENSLDYFSK